MHPIPLGDAAQIMLYHTAIARPRRIGPATPASTAFGAGFGARLDFSRASGDSSRVVVPGSRTSDDVVLEGLDEVLPRREIAPAGSSTHIPKYS
jgi:hypothetical protein